MTVLSLTAGPSPITPSWRLSCSAWLQACRAEQVEASSRAEELQSEADLCRADLKQTQELLGHVESQLATVADDRDNMKKELDGKAAGKRAQQGAPGRRVGRLKVRGRRQCGVQDGAAWLPAWDMAVYPSVCEQHHDQLALHQTVRQPPAITAIDFDCPPPPPRSPPFFSGAAQTGE